MDIGVLDIKIIDTHENDRVLQLEDTEAGSPKLQYNGFEDRYGALMASELRFNLNVTSLIDAKYGHLFTGSETRYKVLLEDVSDEENPVELWRGFLLPEQFSEPYDKGSFFIEFIATDGIGRLKNLDFFGFSTMSVVHVLQTCLSLTGMQLPIMFAESVQNTAFNVNYGDLEIDTSSYIDDKGKGKSCYDVLEAVLTSIGCKVFQYKSKWWIIGLNRLNEETIKFYKYSVSSVFEGFETIDRDRLFRTFFATPLIEMEAPLNKLTMSWDWGADEYLLPKNVVSAVPSNFGYNSLYADLVYWKLTSDDARVEGDTYVPLSDFGYDYSKIHFDKYFNGFVVKSGEPKVVGDVKLLLRSGEVADTTVSSGEKSFIQLTDLPSNYLSLKSPVFIEGSDDVDRTAVLNYEGELRLLGAEFNGEIETAKSAIDEDIENGVLKDHIILEIYYKEHKNQSDTEEVLHLSTRLDNDLPAGYFEIEFTREDNKIRFKLEVKDLMFEKSGYYDFRIYPLVRHDHLDASIFVNVFEFKMNFNSSLDYNVNRGIDFTTSKELEVFHSTTRMDITNRRLMFSESLKNQLESGGLANNFIPVSVKYHRVKEVYNGSSLWYTNIFIGIDDDVYRMLSGGFSLYRKLENATMQVISSDDYFLGQGESGLEVRQINFSYAGGSSVDLILKTDELFVALDASNGSFYLDNWLDKWQLVNGYSVVNKKFHEVIADLYLDLRYDASYAVRGVVSGLIFPLDFLIFNFIDRRDYYITNLTLDLTQGTTEVVMFERLESRGASQEDVIEDSGDPLITISAKSDFVSPVFTLPYWQIIVDYELMNIAPVEAVLKFTKFTDSPLNGGVSTGSVEEVGINQSAGVYKHVIYPLPDEKKGWYEVVLIQGVESNKEYVKVSEILPPVNKITIIAISFKNKTAVIDISHSIGFPGVLKKKWQEMDNDSVLPVGWYPIGPEQEEVISSTSTQITHTFSNTSAYRFWLEGDGVESNEIFLKWEFEL